METQHPFQLQLAVDGYLLQLQSKGNYSEEDLLELKSHLLDETDALAAFPLDEEERFLVARKRLGKEDVLCNEYTKVNGRGFYSRDLFIMVLSICTFLFFMYLYTMITSLVSSLAFTGNFNPVMLGIINYSFQALFLAASLYLVFNCNRYFRFAEKLYRRSPLMFSMVFILLLAVAYFAAFFIGRMPFHIEASGKKISELAGEFRINSDLNAFFGWIIPSTWMLAILLAFVKSYKKTNLLNTVINNSGYLALIILGFFWDFVAAFTRSLNSLSNGNDWIKAVLFGLVWLIGSLLFNLYLKHNILKRNLAFIAFGFVMELGAGIWINPSLRNGMPFSVFFIALVPAYLIGYLMAAWFKQRSKKMVTA